jgi:hypothetical protein
MMVWKSFVSNSATLASRPRVLTTTFMCALSATVRLTSAEEGPKIPAPPVRTYNPMVSVMTGDGAPIFCRSVRPKPAQPIVFRHPGGCRAWPL